MYKYSDIIESFKAYCIEVRVENISFIDLKSYLTVYHHSYVSKIEEIYLELTGIDLWKETERRVKREHEIEEAGVTELALELSDTY